MFQSLSRDSGCSSDQSPEDMPTVATGFNPSVGILGVQATWLYQAQPGECLVSIPQSGFWVFKHMTR